MTKHNWTYMPDKAVPIIKSCNEYHEYEWYCLRGVVHEYISDNHVLTKDEDDVVSSLIKERGGLVRDVIEANKTLLACVDRLTRFLVAKGTEESPPKKTPIYIEEGELNR